MGSLAGLRDTIEWYCDVLPPGIHGTTFEIELRPGRERYKLVSHNSLKHDCLEPTNCLREMITRFSQPTKSDHVVECEDPNNPGT